MEINGNIIIIGEQQVNAPKECSYCHKQKEQNSLRPYGKDGAWLCYDCGQLPENEPFVNAAIRAMLSEVIPISPNDN